MALEGHLGWVREDEFGRSGAEQVFCHTGPVPVLVDAERCDE